MGMCDSLSSSYGIAQDDAVEAHSCSDTYSEIHLVSNTQLLIIQRQDISTQKS